MVTATEAAANAKTQLASELAAGVDWLSLNQEITFTLYKKYILPLDGFIFWVKTLITTKVKGSLHYSSEVDQDEAATIVIDTIVFTAESQIDSFDAINSQNLYIGEFNGMKFAFNSQGKFYKQANLWHYVGIAVKSTFESQLVDDPKVLKNKEVIVSNSLPIWLAMPSYVPPYPGFVCPICEIYPSYLVADNIPPPYAAVHIQDTMALAESAFLNPRLDSSQLASETVRVTTYGVDNKGIITFLNFVLQYSYDYNYIGMVNMPIIRDEKETQNELNTIAQKKTIEFKITYLQNTCRNVARQHILKCIVNSQANFTDGPSSSSGIVVEPTIPTQMEHSNA